MILMLLLSYRTKVAAQMWEDRQTDYAPKRFALCQNYNLRNPAATPNHFADDLIASYMAQRYPYLNWQDTEWLKDTTTNNYFQYKTEWKDKEGRDTKFFVGFESFSDGLEWLFWEDVYCRKNQYEVIEDPQLRNAIREKLLSVFKYTPKDIERADIIEYWTFRVVVPQQTSSIVIDEMPSPELQYVVVIDKEVHLFDRTGEIMKD